MGWERMQRFDAAIAIAGAVRTQVAAVQAELHGARREAVLREALDDLMRLQAVLVADADAAAASLAAAGAEASTMHQVRAVARDLFERHRDRIDAIRAAEGSRAGFVARRAAERAKRAAGTTTAPGDGS